MKKIGILLFTAIIMLGFSLSGFSQKEVNKTFSPKEKISISTVSGDCIVKKGNNNEIKVNLIYSYSDDCFEYEFDERDNYLKIKEDFRGNNCVGKSEWIITTPSDVDIKISSASGDLELNNIDNTISASTASGNITAKSCKDGIKLSTASGNIDLEDVNGKISLSAASGDISVLNASGEFEIKTASGSIEAENIELTYESYFGAASGDVEVILSKTAAYDLTLSSASGNSTLDYNGNNMKGFFEFSARKDNGTIISPIKFDKEEVVEKNGKDYDVKSFTVGNSTPKVIIKTSSGKAQLKK